MFKQITLGLALGSLAALVACTGKGGFSTATGLPDAVNNSASSGNGNNGNAPLDAYQQLQYKGYVSGGGDSGTLVIDIDKTNGDLLLIVPLQINSYIESAQGSVSDLPGVTFMTYKDDKGASYMAVSVPLRYVLKGASFLPTARLPNGDPLPQIAGGELPSLGLRIPGKNNVQFYLYIGVDTVCVYISSPFDPYVGLTFPVENATQTTIGFVSTVPAKSGFDGGFFLSTQMPVDIATIIDDHFHF